MRVATTPQTARIGDISRRVRSVRLGFSLQGPAVHLQQVLARKTISLYSTTIHRTQHLQPSTRVPLLPAPNRLLFINLLLLQTSFCSASTTLTTSVRHLPAMDSRQAGLPFSRPQSQQTLRDPRFASISSSQYASQPNTPRPDTLHKHDPFLRRRNDLDDLHRNTSLAPTPRQYGPPSTSNYSPNHTLATSDTTSSGSQVRRNSQGSGALFGAARMDRLGSQSSEGAGKSRQRSYCY